MPLQNREEGITIPQHELGGSLSGTGKQMDHAAGTGQPDVLREHDQSDVVGHKCTNVV